LGFGPDCPLRLEGPLHPRLKRCIQLPQLFLGPLLGREANRERVRHFVERDPETTDFRGAVSEMRAGMVIAVASFGGNTEQPLDWPTNKVPAAHPGSVDRRRKAGEDQPDPAPRRTVDCGKGLGFGSAGISRCQVVGSTQ
jgi:hypothetical protein